MGGHNGDGLRNVNVFACVRNWNEMFMLLDVYLRGHFGESYSAVLFLKNCFVLNDEDGFTAADKELMSFPWTNST